MHHGDSYRGSFDGVGAPSTYVAVIASPESRISACDNFVSFMIHGFYGNIHPLPVTVCVKVCTVGYDIIVVVPERYSVTLSHCPRP